MIKLYSLMIPISGDPLLLPSPLCPGHHAARMEVAMTQRQVPQRAAVVDRLGAVMKGARERPFRGREGRGEAGKNGGFTQKNGGVNNGKCGIHIDLNWFYSE